MKTHRNYICMIPIVCAIVEIVIALNCACPGLIEKAAGGTVPMKCHWTMRVCVLFGASQLLAALSHFLVKSVEGRMISHGASAVLALGTVLVTTVVIGTCKSSKMICYTGKAWLCVAAGICIVTELICLLNSKDKEIGPKKMF